jgi:hypothetical protein
MKRQLVLFVDATLVLAMIVGGAYISVPLHRGQENMREFSVSSYLIPSYERPLRPIIIRSEKELMQLAQQARKRLNHPDVKGIKNAEESLRGFDFKNECLVLIPYWKPSAYDTRLSAPHLVSRKLVCRLWFQDRNPGTTFRTLGSHAACIAVAVRRESVDEVEVIVGSQVDVLAVN